MKKQLLASALALAVITPAQALPLIDVDAGVGTWLGSYDGYLLNESYDVDNTFKLNDEATSPTHAYVEFRHPIPVLPNLRAAYTRVQTTGGFSETVNVNEIEFSGSSNLDLDLTHIDANLFYELDFIPYVALQAGLGARVFQGGFEFTNNVDSSINESIDFSGVPLPQLSLGARIDLPFTGLYITGKADGVAYGKSQLLDWSAGAGYELSVPLLMGARIEGGWRQWGLKLDPSDFDIDGLNDNIDTTLSGVYLNAGLFF